MKSTKSIITLLLFALLLLGRVHADSESGSLRQATIDASPSKDLSSSDWASIKAAHRKWQHRFSKSDDGKSWQTVNPGQAMSATFDGRGFLCEPTGADQQPWKWGLELQGYGVGELITLSPAKGGRVSEKETRLTFQRDERLEEWFVNDGRGIEQGWTLSERPAGTKRKNSRLRLELAVKGGLRPEVAGEGKAIRFLDPATETAVLTYGGLKAWDAEGKLLEARFQTPEKEFGTVILEVEDHSAVYPLTIDPLVQQAYLKASNTGADDRFGGAVGINGDTVVVGAIGESSSTTGVNSTPDDAASFAGAAYVFVRSGGSWTQQAYLKASNAGWGDQFGISVGIDGDTVVVGANREDSSTMGVNSTPDEAASEGGAAYVFVRSGGVWTQQAYLKASNTGLDDQFGISVGISGDTVVVGARNEDSSTTGVNSTPDDAARNAGAAYVFVRSAGSWTQQAYLKARNTEVWDQFGTSVGVDGDTLVVGAQCEDSSTTGVNSNPDEGSENAGAAYVFARSAGSWTEQAYLKASNTEAFDSFGYSVGIDGNTVVVGALYEDSSTTGVNSTPDDAASFAGAAYVFVRSAGIWTQQAYLKASNTGANDFFGHSVGVDGDTVVVGASGEDSSTTGVNSTPDEGATVSGAAYVFVRSAGIWTQQAYLKASNTGEGDQFGRSVAVSGDTVVVGANLEDSSTTGVNSTPDEGAIFSGASYVFLIPPPPVQAAKPDLLLSKVGGAKRGDDIYNSTGARQKVTQNSRAGQTSRFRFELQNDGDEPGIFVLRGSNNPSPGRVKRDVWRVRFFQFHSGRRSNVTGSVRRGRTISLAGGAQTEFLATYRLKKRPGVRVSRQKRIRSFYIVVRDSANRGAVADRVKPVVIRRR